jgi:hypothetical protein
VSNRSRQAQRLARRLTSLADVVIEVTHQGRQQYLIQWGNGPTTESMLKQATEELATGRYPDLSTRMLDYARGYSARAFAACAVASQRDGSLTTAIQAGVKERDRLGVTSPRWSHLSAEELIAHQHIERVLEETANPDRSLVPADEPAIEALVRLSNGNEYAMLPALVSPGRLQSERRQLNAKPKPYRRWTCALLPRPRLRYRPDDCPTGSSASATSARCLGSAGQQRTS